MRVKALLALVMGFALAVACGSSTGTSTTQPLSGKRICISQIVGVDLLFTFTSDMQAAGRDSGNGVDFQAVYSNGDPSKQAATVEQLISSGRCNALAVVTAVSADLSATWTSVANHAKQLHLPMSNHSSDWITGVTQNLSNPHCPAGQVVGQAAAAWYQAHGSTGEVGVIDTAISPSLSSRVTCFEQAFTAATGYKGKFWSGTSDNTPQQGASATASLLQAHPAIDVLFTWGGSSSVGAEQAAHEAARNSPDKFFLSTIEISDGQYAEMAAGGTILQAAAPFVYGFSAVAMERGLELALLGKTIPPTGYIKAVVVNKDNAENLLQASHHQFLSENTHYFDDLMLYFNTPVKNGDPFPDASTGFTWAGAKTSPKA